jgi:excisionase family DNA binding protein
MLLIEEKPPQPMLTTLDVAKRLRYSERTVKRLLTNGEIPGFKIGGNWRIDPDVFEQFLKEGHIRHTQHDK